MQKTKLHISLFKRIRCISISISLLKSYRYGNRNLSIRIKAMAKMCVVPIKISHCHKMHFYKLTKSPALFKLGLYSFDILGCFVSLSVHALFALTRSCLLSSIRVCITCVCEWPQRKIFVPEKLELQNNNFKFNLAIKISTIFVCCRVSSLFIYNLTDS